MSFTSKKVTTGKAIKAKAINKTETNAPTPYSAFKTILIRPWLIRAESERWTLFSIVVRISADKPFSMKLKLDVRRLRRVKGNTLSVGSRDCTHRFDAWMKTQNTVTLIRTGPAPITNVAKGRFVLMVNREVVRDIQLSKLNNKTHIFVNSLL